MHMKNERSSFVLLLKDLFGALHVYRSKYLRRHHVYDIDFSSTHDT